MKAQTALPQALYRTNLQLQARLAALLQDTARQWLDFWQRLVEEGVLESDAGLQALGRHDWQALAALPADAFWRQVQQRFGDQQAAAQVAVAVQAAFARGLQDAMRDWRRDTAAALDEAGLGFPANNPMWGALFQGWDAIPPGLVVSAATAGASKPSAPRARAPKPAPRPRPASPRGAKPRRAGKPRAPEAAPRP
ncbi:hypothetical protein [Pseudoxanthomonas sp. SGNA-20]|uniref:hypothetical protein n=1 Tax=Pseudoxanthomonas sp. SGNA-20 TaxID=2493088 RepID=UPI0018F372D0|nr:hypothetical protein [Pseudoxanthomonas sp. SGNA-20]